MKKIVIGTAFGTFIGMSIFTGMILIGEKIEYHIRTNNKKEEEWMVATPLNH